MKEDLRVVKTKRNIKKVMQELLQKKPAEKITVTELASLAMINKGTFYLHYSDISELYQEIIHDFLENTLGAYDYYDKFFTDPHEFMTMFLADFKRDDFKKAFPFFQVSKERLPVPYLVTETILKHIMETGCITDTVENRIRVQCCISAMTSPLFHFDTTHFDTIVDVTSEMISKMIPHSKLTL